MFKNKFSKKLRKNIRETPSLWWRNYHFLGNIIFHFFCIFDFPLFMNFYLDIYKFFLDGEYTEKCLN